MSHKKVMVSTALFFFLLSTSSYAQAPSKDRLHVIYTGMAKKTSSVYMVSALERMTGAKESAIKVKKAILTPSIRIKNLSVFSGVDRIPSGSLGNSYQEAIKKFVPKKKVEALKSNFDVLFTQTDFKYPVIDQVQARFADDNRFPAKIKALLGKIKADDGKEYDAILLDDKGPYANDMWQAQTCFKYSVIVNGVKGELVSFGNFYGGYSSLLPMLEDELKASKNDVLLLDTGSSFSEYGYKYVTPIFELLQYDAILPSVRDISSSYDDLVSAQKKLPLVNSNVFKPGDNKTLFKDHVMITKDGVRVGVIGLVSPSHQAESYIKEANRVIIKDPVNTAAELIKKIGKNADVVIALVDVSPRELLELEQLSGLSMILGKDQDEVPPFPEKYISFSKSNNSLVRYPYFTGTVGNKYFSSLKLYFQSVQGGGIKEKALLWEKYPLDIYSKKDPVVQSLENKSIIASYGAEDPVLLPDYRELFPDREGKDITYPADEVSTLVANVLLLDTGADVAMYTKRSKLSSSVTGSISESIIRSWFRDKNETVVVTRMNGATLMSLVSLMREYESLQDPTKPPAVVVGVDPNGMMVKDKPISGSEYYTVVTVRQVFDAVDIYPQFRSLKPTGQISKNKEHTTAFLIPYLRSRQGLAWDSELEKMMTDPDINEGPYFRWNIKRVAFEFLAHKVIGVQDYIYVPDARVQPVSERNIATNIDTSLELYGSRWNWETGTVMNFMDSKISSQGQTISTAAMDDASVYTDFKYKIWKFSTYFFGRSLGPFFNITYDTQFKPMYGNPRKRQLRFTPGITLSDGSVLDNVRLGWMLEQDYAVSPSDSERGIYFYTDAQFFLPASNSSLQSYVNFKYFFDAPTDSEMDLGVELELSLSLNVPIYRSFFIAPYFKYFLFRGKVEPLRKFGTSSTVGVSVGFSEVIKP